MNPQTYTKPMSFKITEENSSQKNIVENIKFDFQSGETENLSILKKSRSLYRFSVFILLLASTVVIGSIAEAVIFANELFETSTFIGTLYISMVSALIYFVAIFGYREIIKYVEIDRVEKIQEKAKSLEKNATKDSLNFANSIIQKYKNHGNPEIIEGVESFKKELSDLEYSQILPKLSEKILSPIDREVEQLLFKYAKENALATAISPVPLFDALFIIWRNLRMVNQISALYGFRTGIVGNFILLRRVAEQLIFIGVAEITADSFSILTGQTIASKISSSIAQGVGHSILTIRVGLATIQVSRPIQKKSDTSMILRFLKSFSPFKKDKR